MSNPHIEVSWGWGLKGNQYLKNIFVTYAQLTREQLRKRFDAQGGMCAMCKVTLAWPMEKKDRWGFPFEIDHWHEGGEKRCTKQEHIRGLLCKLCNMELRRTKDKPTDPKFAAYLEKYGKVLK